MDISTYTNDEKEILRHPMRGCPERAMLSNWDCFIQATNRLDVAQCDARLSSGIRDQSYYGNDISNRDPYYYYGYSSSNFNNYYGSSYNIKEEIMCRRLQEYVSCIKYPVYDQCGYQAWYATFEAIQRPLRVFAPYCRLGAMNFHLSKSLALLSICSLFLLFYSF
uniref:Uncharacterized protein n=1 Tax=Romanomermis culicivorax TaxID=13658 RepID=A0A915KCK4_ROMCU